jgi:hypothetical protein
VSTAFGNRPGGRSPAEGFGLGLCCVGFFEDDAVAQCFELADGVGFGVFGSTSGVVAGFRVTADLAGSSHRWESASDDVKFPSCQGCATRGFCVVGC